MPEKMSRGNLDAPKLEWSDTITALRKTRLTTPKTLALCGFAVSSRHLAPYDKRNVAIAGCNEAYAADYMKTSEGIFRADYWFQMHMLEDWSRENNPNDPRHPEWLSLQHNFPIIMQEKFPNVPNAEAFPLAECDEMFFSNVWTIDLVKGKKRKWLDVYKHGYYTSSFAWMIAYAIWQQKWDMIEVWGFNMGTQSEYMYQKPGAEFWAGQALALNVGLAIADNSPILKGMLYGYEIANVLLPTQMQGRLKEISEELSPLKDKALKQHGARLMIENLSSHPDFVQRLPELVTQLEVQHQAELAATATVNFYLGAESVVNEYLNHTANRHVGSESGWVDRLTMEVHKTKIRSDIEEVHTNMDAVSGAKMELNRNLLLYALDPEAVASWERRLIELRNKEIFWTGRLSLALGRLSQIEQFIFTSENRNANMTDERDYGHIIVPDLYDKATDVLKLGDSDDKKKTETVSSEVTGGTGGNSGEPGQSA